MDEHGSSKRSTNRSPAHKKAALATRHPIRSGPFDPSVLGRAAHELIAELAVAGLRNPDFERISLAVRAHPATKQPAVRQQAARQWLTCAASLYFRLFALPAGWDLVGAEVAGPRCRLDLLWRNRFGQDVLADELKTGKAGDLVGGARLDDQLDRQRRDCIDLHGERFIGIRLLVLAAPRRSFFVAPDGTRRPLYDETTT